MSDIDSKARIAALEARKAPDLDEATKAVEWHMGKGAMLALENLTPGGSEYVGDIERCVAYIRQRQTAQHARIVRLTKQLRNVQGEGQ